MPDDSEAAAQVAAAEDQRYAAMLAGDTSALAQLLSDRLTYVHSSALLDTRQSLLAKISGRSIVYSAVDHPVRQIVVLCDAVLVTGEMHASVLVDGEPRRVDSSVLAVWAAEDGAWRLAAFQATPLP
ncbi:MAG: nuclear transport factor 2 family protein [Streptosporangiaceae bacterium]